jgi:hypothetical protein
MSTYRLRPKIIQLPWHCRSHKTRRQSRLNISSNIGRDKSFVDDLNKERGIVRMRVAFVPRSAEIQPLFWRFVTSFSLARTQLCSLWLQPLPAALSSRLASYLCTPCDSGTERPVEASQLCVRERVRACNSHPSSSQRFAAGAAVRRSALADRCFAARCETLILPSPAIA